LIKSASGRFFSSGLGIDLSKFKRYNLPTLERGKKMARILVVDDDQHCRRLAKSLLQRAGYEVAVADDGVDGLAQAKQFKPDLIVINGMMPRLLGPEMLLRLKDDPELSGILTIGDSADADLRRQFIENGADRVVVRAWHPTVYLAAVAGVLAAREVAST
jgi:CheY-like chemotaxis protein